MPDEDSAKKGKGILHPEGMRAVRELTVGLVHELNNVLGVIIGNTHLLPDCHSKHGEHDQRHDGERRGHRPARRRRRPGQPGHPRRHHQENPARRC